MYHQGLQQEEQKRSSSAPGSRIQPAPHLLPIHERPESPFARMSEQLKLFEDKQPLLTRLNGSKPTILVLYAVLVLGIVYHLAATNGNSATGAAALEPVRLQSLSSDCSSEHASSTSISRGGSRSSSTSGSSSSSSSGSSGNSNWTCAYGSLPGTWVSAAAPGDKWQVLDPDCQLHNWLAVYAAAGRMNSSSSSSSSSSAGSSPGADVEVGVVGAEEAAAAAGDGGISVSSEAAGKQLADTAAAGQSDAGADSSSSSTSSSSSSSGHPPLVRILLLSDSVDRFIVQHVCEHLGGVKQTHTMKPTAAAEAAEVAAAAAALAEQQQQQQQQGQAPAAAAGPAAPTTLNKTAYAFHTCESTAPLKLASSYFPGVHPTGPFHRFSAQNFKQRIDSAREMWSAFAGPDSEPDMVSVASLLWDVARIYMHERGALEGREELDRRVLDGWLFNFTQVVAYAKQAFPETKLWVTHTTMPPHHALNTGLMTKPYLGRRYFIHQLNAAAATAAHKMGMQLVDYEAVAERFAEGQSHLTDLIHPNALVGVEVFNLMLNLVRQQQQQQQLDRRRV